MRPTDAPHKHSSAYCPLKLCAGHLVAVMDDEGPVVMLATQSIQRHWSTQQDHALLEIVALRSALRRCMAAANWIEIHNIAKTALEHSDHLAGTGRST